MLPYPGCSGILQQQVYVEFMPCHLPSNLFLLFLLNNSLLHILEICTAYLYTCPRPLTTNYQHINTYEQKLYRLWFVVIFVLCTDCFVNSKVILVCQQQCINSDRKRLILHEYAHIFPQIASINEESTYLSTSDIHCWSLLYPYMHIQRLSILIHTLLEWYSKKKYCNAKPARTINNK